MRKCTIVKPVTIPPGHKLILNELQVNARINQIAQSNEEGIFITLKHLQFKAGEILHMEEEDIQVFEKKNSVIPEEKKEEPEEKKEEPEEKKEEPEEKKQPRKRPRGRPRKSVKD